MESTQAELEETFNHAFQLGHCQHHRMDKVKKLTKALTSMEWHASTMCKLQGSQSECKYKSVSIVLGKTTVDDVNYSHIYVYCMV